MLNQRSPDASPSREGDSTSDTRIVGGRGVTDAPGRGGATVPAVFVPYAVFSCAITLTQIFHVPRELLAVAESKWSCSCWMNKRIIQAPSTEWERLADLRMMLIPSGGGVWDQVTWPIIIMRVQPLPQRLTCWCHQWKVRRAESAKVFYLALTMFLCICGTVWTVNSKKYIHLVLFGPRRVLSGKYVSSWSLCTNVLIIKTSSVIFHLVHQSDGEHAIPNTFTPPHPETCCITISVTVTSNITACSFLYIDMMLGEGGGCWESPLPKHPMVFGLCPTEGINPAVWKIKRPFGRWEKSFGLHVWSRERWRRAPPPRWLMADDLSSAADAPLVVTGKVCPPRRCQETCRTGMSSVSRSLPLKGFRKFC